MVSTSPIEWLPCYRIVASRFPPVGLFDRVATEADMEMVFELESLTNPRVRQEMGELSLVHPDERVYGPGSTPIMAAFTHLGDKKTRFSDNSYGVYYAALELNTAIAETVYHREIFMASTNESPIDLTMRVYAADLIAKMHDLRGQATAIPEIYHHTNYSASQAMGAQLRNEGSWGVVYDSVRNTGGQCAGAFRPKALSNCRQANHLAYAWNGKKIAHVVELTLLY